MANSLKSATFEPIKEFTLPTGAEIISRETRITVEQIKNGFLLRKSHDIKWRDSRDEDEEGRGTRYDYYTEVYYTKENPMTFKEPKEMSLADKL